MYVREDSFVEYIHKVELCGCSLIGSCSAYDDIQLTELAQIHHKRFSYVLYPVRQHTPFMNGVVYLWGRRIATSCVNKPTFSTLFINNLVFPYRVTLFVNSPLRVPT
jgi:hypothetical protein